MKCATTLFFCFIVSLCWTQNQHEGVIVDTENKEPIEFVCIYNGEDHTMSNAIEEIHLTSAPKNPPYNKKVE